MRSGHDPLGARFPMFHTGGDEVNLDCWAKDHNVIDWIKKNGYPFVPQDSQEGYVKLYAVFEEKIRVIEGSKWVFEVIYGGRKFMDNRAN